MEVQCHKQEAFVLVQMVVLLDILVEEVDILVGEVDSLVEELDSLEVELHILVEHPAEQHNPEDSLAELVEQNLEELLEEHIQPVAKCKQESTAPLSGDDSPDHKWMTILDGVGSNGHFALILQQAFPL